MARTARRTAITGFLLLLATCSEASAAYVGDRFFPSTLATTVPTPAAFYNPPYFVRLPDTATTHEIDIPTTYSRLVTRDLSVFFTETFRILEDSNRGTRSGFDNLVIGAQYQLYTNPEHHSSLPWVVRRRSAVPERPESPRDALPGGVGSPDFIHNGDATPWPTCGAG